MQPFKVLYDDAANFAKVWNHKGIHIPMQDAHIQFASDYANVVLSNFIRTIAEQRAKKVAAEEQASKPLVTLV